MMNAFVIPTLRERSVIVINAIYLNRKYLPFLFSSMLEICRCAQPLVFPVYFQTETIPLFTLKKILFPIQRFIF